MATRPGRARKLALLGSFAVYLLPLATPRGVRFCGRALLDEVTGRAGPIEAAWVRTDVAIVLLIQAVAFGLLYWLCRRRRGFPPLVPLFAVPVFIVALNALYIVLIPQRFVMEPDTAPLRDTWAEACVLDDRSLVAVPASTHEALARAREAWVVRPDLRYEVLKMPGCESTPLGVSADQVGQTILGIAPGGRALLERRDQGTGPARWWYVGGAARTPVRVESPVEDAQLDGPPILSTDGEWVAWLRREATGSDARGLATILLRTIDGRRELSVTPATASPGRLRLLVLDEGGGEVMLAHNEREFLAVGFDGGLLWGPFTPEGVRPLADTFRRIGTGWVAWDGYRGRDPYGVVWTTAQGRGRYGVLKGRTVAGVAVDPTGATIAISVTASVSVGDVRDAVSVLRAADGAELFRRYLPRRARSAVAFLGPEFFAYSEHEGTWSRVRVLRMAG